MVVMNFLADEILTQPGVVMALVGLLGMLLMKRPIEKIISSVIKIYVGMEIFNLGLTAMENQITVFTKFSLKLIGAKEITNISSSIPQLASYDEIMSAAALMLGMAYVVNIIVARISKFKVIYLTGHWSHWTCVMVAGVLMNYLGLKGGWVIILGGIIVGLYQVIFPSILQPYTSRLTDGAPIAFGHGSSMACLISSFLGDKLGNKKHNMEDIKLSNRLSFLKEVVVTVGLSMSILYVALAIIVGKEFTTTLAGGKNWIMFSIFAGLKFSAGLMALLYGIRMFIGEITPAFQGISTKLVPGAIPAFDCPVFFQYGLNSLMIGFVISQICAVISMAILMRMDLPVPIMMVTFENFFGGGVAAIFGNKMGGRRGAIIAALFYGFTATLGRALFFPMLGAVTDFAQSCGEWDQMVIVTVIGWIGKILGLTKYAF
jgi:PTS system ascorbate-specific IIC component